jgi:hypothetical protein
LGFHDRPDWAARVGFLAALAAILVATLTPAGSINVLSGGFFCLRCGDASLANVLRNIILFLPLGFFGLFVLRRTFVGLGRRRALGAVTLLGGALSGGVELLQLFIPGRNPLVVDLLANTAGAALGAMLAASMPVWLRPAGTARRRLFGAVLVASAILAAAPAWLLVPAPPHEALLTQWNPPLGRVGPYAGDISDARLGPPSDPAAGDPRRAAALLSQGRIPAELDVPGRLLAGQTLTLTLQAAAPVDKSRGLFRIISLADGKEALAVSVRGTSVMASLGYRADWVGLARPRVRARDHLAGASPGDTVALALTILHDGALRLDATVAGQDALRQEAPGGDPSMGWSLLYYPYGLGPWGAAALGFLWCGMLLLGPAFLAPTRLAAAASGAAVLMVLALTPVVAPLLGLLPMAGWAGAIAGWVVGRGVRGRVDSAGWSEARPTVMADSPTPQPTASERASRTGSAS